MGARAGAQAAGGRWARKRAGRASAGWRQAQACRQARRRRSAQQAGRAAAGARGAAAGERTRHGRAGERGRRRQGRAGRPARRPVRVWCAQLAGLGVLVHLTQFLAWFDSVFFPSHQMNTVYCKIIFFEKKIYFKYN